MPKQGVLLVNLGSPSTTDTADVREYLMEFLSDRRVFDAPSPIREYILYAKVRPFRPQKTGTAYKKIWTDKGSPLLVTSEEVRAKLQEQVKPVVEIAMRYQDPSIESALKKLAAQGVEELFVIPQYPQYAMSSYETVVVKVREDVAKFTPQMKVDILSPFYAEPDYIDTLLESADEYLKKDYDHLLFSFHGIPERHLRKADSSKAHCTRVPDCCRTPSTAHETCYRAQCIRTVDEFVKKAGIPVEKHSISFQSRFGREPWLQPYTDKELVRLGREGKKLLIMCPAFVADCLETLEEIQMEGKDDFLAAGGKEFTAIPCLNTRPSWIHFLQKQVEQFQERMAAPTPKVAVGAFSSSP